MKLTTYNTAGIKWLLPSNSGILLCNRVPLTTPNLCLRWYISSHRLSCGMCTSLGDIVFLPRPNSWVQRSKNSLLSPSASSNFALYSGIGHVPIAYTERYVGRHDIHVPPYKIVYKHCVWCTPCACRKPMKCNCILYALKGLAHLASDMEGQGMVKGLTWHCGTCSKVSITHLELMLHPSLHLSDT